MWRKTTLWLTGLGILSAILFSTISTAIWSWFWYKQMVSGPATGPSQSMLNLAQFCSVLSHIGTSVGAIALIIHLIRVVNFTQMFQEDWELSQSILSNRGEANN